MIFDVDFLSIARDTIDLLHARDLLLSASGSAKEVKGGSRENSRTICDLLRNVTRHRRRRHCPPPPPAPPSPPPLRRRRFISRVSFRRYCHSRPIKNARSHGRGVRIVESLNKGTCNGGDSRKKGPNRSVGLFPRGRFVQFFYIFTPSGSVSMFLNEQQGADINKHNLC